MRRLLIAATMTFAMTVISCGGTSENKVSSSPAPRFVAVESTIVPQEVAPEPTPDWSIPYVPPVAGQTQARPVAPAQQGSSMAACASAPMRAPSRPTTETQTLQSGRVTMTINVQRKTFVVQGCTNRQLLDSAMRNLPIKASSTGYATTTGWHPLVDWSRKPSSSGCSLETAKLEVTFTVYIPESSTMEGVLASERDRWNATVSTATIHEQRHVDINIQATKSLQTALARLPSRPTCTALDASVRSTVDSAVAETMRQHEAFHAEERARVGSTH